MEGEGEDLNFKGSMVSKGGWVGMLVSCVDLLCIHNCACANVVCVWVKACSVTVPL